MKQFFERNWQHLVVLILFIIIMMTYFSPQFDGHHIDQHDVKQFKGMAHETVHFREKTGEEPLWTNSMFGGMPTTQITVSYPGNFFQQSLLWLQMNLGFPTAIFLMHLIGFYLLALFLRVRPLVGFIGAIAFALASYEIVILQAGHNSKAMTVALMAPVVGAFIYAFRSNWKWGAVLSALFMTYQVASNHLQVTYYMIFLLFGLGIYELVRAIRSKNLKPFFITSGSLIAAYLLAIFINYGNVSLTGDYAKYTIRGGNDLSIQPNGEPAIKNTTGLDKEYITNWSYGVGESFTLVSPYVKGSSSTQLANTSFAELIQNSDRSSGDIKKLMDAPYPVYWGDQPMTSGPVYVGVVMIFLFLMGLVYIKSSIKWVYLVVAVLALALSWGKNFMGLTDFFIDNIPGYNKFRTVTIVLVLVELIVPIVVVLLLEQLYKEREAIRADKRKFITFSATFIVLLLGVKYAGLGDNYTSKDEIKRMEQVPEEVAKQIAGMDPAFFAQNYNIDVKDPAQLKGLIDAQVESSYEQYELMKGARKDIFNSSMNRSILFAFLIFGVMALFFFTAVPTYVVMICVAGLVLMDLIPVDQNYLSAELVNDRFYKFWIPQGEALYPNLPEAADLQILEAESNADPKVKMAVAKGERMGAEKAEELAYSGGERRRVIEAYRFAELNLATNYRVFDYNGGWSSSRASYFHKSLGGYHGAKLRNIQNLFEFHIANSNNAVLNMLNVKYLIQQDKLSQNPEAMGNAWFVKRVKTVDSPDEEIRSLGKQFELKNAGEGKFLVNGKVVTEALVYGGEKLQYLISEMDTLDVPMSNGLRKEIEAVWVMDTNQVTNLVPRMTLEADTANSFRELISYKVLSEFIPAEEAVMLKAQASGLKKMDFSGSGEIRMKSYAPNRIVYQSNSDSDQLAVFSEIYYPDGWKAIVDGKEQPILKVNYALRGLALNGGKHTIEFVYGSAKYERSNSFALIGTGILILMAGGLAWKQRRKQD